MGNLKQEGRSFRELVALRQELKLWSFCFLCCFVECAACTAVSEKHAARLKNSVLLFYHDTPSSGAYKAVSQWPCRSDTSSSSFAFYAENTLWSRRMFSHLKSSARYKDEAENHTQGHPFLTWQSRAPNSAVLWSAALAVQCYFICLYN